MLSDLVAIVRAVFLALLKGSAPEQLAAGFTLGMIMGLVPKGNLIALSLCVLLFSLRCNKGLGILAAVAFSFVGAWTDPFAHKLGLMALGVDALQPMYASVLSLPLGPWIGFHNTVTAGCLLLGVYFAYPVYWITRQFFAAFRSLRGPRDNDDELERRIDARPAARSGVAA
jgi:uncharacterized protein (TIGR03546 family)